MNFTPFGSPFTGSIPTASMHQFATAKFAHNMGAGGSQVVGVLSGGEGGVHYLRPVDPNGFTVQGGNNQQQQIITLPISITGKPGENQQQAVQIHVVNPNMTGNSGNGMSNNSPKYHLGLSPLSLHNFPQGVLTVAYAQQGQQGAAESLQMQLQQAQIQVTQASNTPISQGNLDASNNNNTQTQMQATVQHQQILSGSDKQPYPVAVVAHIPQDLIMRDQEGGGGNNQDSKEQSQLVIVKGGDSDKEGDEHLSIATTMPATWQSLAAPGSTIADYLSRMPVTSLPMNLHHFLKFSAETIKRESTIESSPLSSAEFADGATSVDPDAPLVENGVKQKKKKKYKKKAPKPKRPRPGQVHIATALDGTTLFCCPECHMAYPDKELLEQHLVGHKIERRFICDICGAGLKRKEHLERHKLGHNPDRPFTCSVCMKGFKRKEHLNLHFVIHSGEKTEICPECGKGFYRKDHLRKHARSHIAKRVKEELSNHQQQTKQQEHDQQQQQLQQEQLQQQQEHMQQQHQSGQATLLTTVVLPTAAETGAMMLQHHQH